MDLWPDSVLPTSWPGFIEDFAQLWIFGVVTLMILLVLVWVGLKASSRVLSGLTETLPLFVPVYVSIYLTFAWGWGAENTANWFLLAAAALAIAIWIGVANVRARFLTPDLADPTAYQQMRTEFFALVAQIPQPTTPIPSGGTQPVRTFGAESPADGPLATERIGPYIEEIDEMIGFSGQSRLGDSGIWSTGIGYLEVWRRLDFARNSILAQTAGNALESQQAALKLRLVNSNLPQATYTELLESLNSTTDTNRPMMLFTVASTLSSFAHSAKRKLLTLQMRLHWLVVLIMFVAGGLFSLSVVVDGTEGKASGTMAATLFLLGGISGILSLLWNRRSVTDGDQGEDEGLFRVELARAFTLSGMAAVLAVFLIANLPAMTDAASGIFNESSTVDTGGEQTPTPVDSSGEQTSTPFAIMGFQQESVPDVSEQSVADEVERNPPKTPWVAPEDVFQLQNTSALIIALIAGWIPERLFKSMTAYGNRLKLDIESVSKSG